MASISKINGKYRALIRRKGHKSISKWFDTATKAHAWADKIESLIKAGKQLPSDKPTISKIIEKYRTMRSKTRPILDTSTEHYVLKMLDRSLGDKSDLTADDLVAWAHQRREEGAGAYTVNTDLSKLGTVFRYAHPELMPSIVAARPKLAYLGLIGGGGIRERRPTEDEMVALLAELESHRGIKYRHFAEFAAMTAMRRGEVAKIRWDDIDHDKKMILVRDRKDPRKKMGNDQWVPLLYGSYELAMSQPKEDERIFPISDRTMSKYFKEACDKLGIVDLHLHDLRHEGISRMFESGLQIQHVSIVSGHKKWDHLRRYTNIKPESLHSLPSTSPQGSSQRQPHQPIASHRPDRSLPQEFPD